ncbi:DsbA family oxidoreductase [Tsukamurella pseudospumae]|uniref:Protein-disulfide isomerase n=1 Tax=Tsukamurella pseudospumae TaxID=239498 RepID=A0A137ZYW2_9ACTN|nr:DsbA family oxidoreductase [Tsukamurella pseudospumae]KXO97913.1 protein-disulfide isomerase [Tsukamurella pseudospumae]KXP03386.1 protein-disulfide isomerase [Tsukamurella pseudospumae]
MRVDIWTDINCPFCYIGKARFEQALEGFPHASDVEIVHRSFELDPTSKPGSSAPVVPMLAKKYGISEAQAAANERGLGAQAQELGLAYQVEGRDAGNSFDMHRLLHWALDLGRQEALLDALYRANFAESEPAFGSRDRLVEIAESAGFDGAAARAVLEDETAYADAVRADEEAASRIGIGGVPFFVFDGKYAVSGAQPPAVFTDALDKVWGDRPEPLTVIGGDDDAACGPDGCELPQRG